MNKIVVGLLVAVCLLGFALILLNERMGAEVATPVVSENVQPREVQEGQISAKAEPASEASNVPDAPVSGEDRKSLSDSAMQPAKDVAEMAQA